MSPKVGKGAIVVSAAAAVGGGALEAGREAVVAHRKGEPLALSPGKIALAAGAAALLAGGTKVALDNRAATSTFEAAAKEGAETTQKPPKIRPEPPGSRAPKATAPRPTKQTGLKEGPHAPKATAPRPTKQTGLKEGPRVPFSGPGTEFATKLERHAHQVALSYGTKGKPGLLHELLGEDGRVPKHYLDMDRMANWVRKFETGGRLVASKYQGEFTTQFAQKELAGHLEKALTELSPDRFQAVAARVFSSNVEQATVKDVADSIAYSAQRTWELRAGFRKPLEGSLVTVLPHR